MKAIRAPFFHFFYPIQVGTISSDFLLDLNIYLYEWIEKKRNDVKSTREGDKIALQHRSRARSVSSDFLLDLNIYLYESIEKKRNDIKMYGRKGDKIALQHRASRKERKKRGE